jgi:sirohydrochlorin ferrochelatase
MASPALLIVGHGTNDAVGVAEFLKVVADVAALVPYVIVEPCFLELAQPTIDAGFSRCVERGAREITVVPLLLFTAGHAERDIPAAVKAAAAKHPENIAVRQASTLGCHPAVIELSAQRFREATATVNATPLDQIALLFVGRGSKDAHATAEMHRFAKLRHEKTPTAGLATCFIAMAQPTFEQGLDAIANSPCAQIVVQPHLLFHGQLFEDVKKAVGERAAKCPDRRWLVVQPLGVGPLLVQAILSVAAVE